MTPHELLGAGHDLSGRGDVFSSSRTASHVVLVDIHLGIEVIFDVWVVPSPTECLSGVVGMEQRDGRNGDYLKHAYLIFTMLWMALLQTIGSYPCSSGHTQERCYWEDHILSRAGPRKWRSIGKGSTMMQHAACYATIHSTPAILTTLDVPLGSTLTSSTISPFRTPPSCSQQGHSVPPHRSLERVFDRANRHHGSFKLLAG